MTWSGLFDNHADLEEALLFFRFFLLYFLGKHQLSLFSSKVCGSHSFDTADCFSNFPLIVSDHARSDCSTTYHWFISTCICIWTSRFDHTIMKTTLYQMKSGCGDIQVPWETSLHVYLDCGNIYALSSHLGVKYQGGLRLSTFQ